MKIVWSDLTEETQIKLAAKVTGSLYSMWPLHKQNVAGRSELYDRVRDELDAWDELGQLDVDAIVEDLRDGKTSWST